MPLYYLGVLYELKLIFIQSTDIEKTKYSEHYQLKEYLFNETRN